MSQPTARMFDARQLGVLLLDNFDSFSFSLADEFRRRGAVVHVRRNNTPVRAAWQCVAELPEPRLIVLSPGPGAPVQAGCCIQLIHHAAGKIPIFGVCLGHQAIVEAFGGVVASAGEIVHGKASRIEHARAGIFAGLPSPLLGGRYHSLAATLVPPSFNVTARCGETVMAVEHREFPLVGVQFHPESILTPQGGIIIENVMAWALRWHERGESARHDSGGRDIHA